jgi:PST family polysaccharide transporter
VAKGRAGLLIFCELAWGAVSLGLSWPCVKYFGLNGAGIAFFGSYLFHAVLLYPIVRKLSGFRWSRENWHTGLLFASSILVVFCSLISLPLLGASAIGVAAAAGSTIYSVRVLSKLITWAELPKPLRRLLVQVRLAPSI